MSGDLQQRHLRDSRDHSALGKGGGGPPVPLTSPKLQKAALPPGHTELSSVGLSTSHRLSRASQHWRETVGLGHQSSALHM